MIWKKVILNHNKVILKAIQANTRNLSISRVLAENHYEVLGLKRDATQAEIKNAYFKLSKIYHPDKISATDENLAKFRAIITAYEVLGKSMNSEIFTGLSIELSPYISIYLK